LRTAGFEELPAVYLREAGRQAGFLVQRFQVSVFLGFGFDDFV